MVTGKATRIEPNSLLLAALPACLLQSFSMFVLGHALLAPFSHTSHRFLLSTISVASIGGDALDASDLLGPPTLPEISQQSAGPGAVWASRPAVSARPLASSAAASAAPSACARAAWLFATQYGAVRSWRRKSASSLRRSALVPAVPFSGNA